MKDRNGERRGSWSLCSPDGRDSQHRLGVAMQYGSAAMVAAATTSHACWGSHVLAAVWASEP